MRVPVAPLSILALILLAAALPAPPTGAADAADAAAAAGIHGAGSAEIAGGYLKVGDAADREAYLARRRALLDRRDTAPSTAAPSTAAPATVQEPRGGVVGTVFLLPFYRVDTTSGGGVTTLWAVRNPGASTIAIEAEYFDVFGNLESSEMFSLGANRTITRNLRDVGGLIPDVDGFSRGFALITAQQSGYLGGDFFDVTVNQDFATGGRMIKTEETFNCALTDSRFGVGGIFSGGTDLTLLVASPLGAGAMDPTITFAVYDEPGNLIGTIDLFTSLVTQQIAVGDLLDLLVAPPAVGGVEVMFNLGTGGGHTLATFSAEDRFSIGIEGECIVTFL